MNTEEPDPEKVVEELVPDPQIESEVHLESDVQTESHPETEPGSQPDEPLVLPEIESQEPSTEAKPVSPQKPMNVPAILLTILVVVLLGVIGWLLYDKYMPGAAKIETVQSAQDTSRKKTDDNVQAQVLKSAE